MLAVNHLQQSVSGGSCQDVTVLAEQETGHIARHDRTVKSLYLHVVEDTAVVSLKGAIHTEVEQTVLVLSDTVHIVAGHPVLSFILFFNNVELVTVVPVKTITGGNPYKAVLIAVDLIGETAR